MLPERCQLTLDCQDGQDQRPQLALEGSRIQTLEDLVEPLSYGLQRAPLVTDTYSPLDRTPLSSLECEDSWRKAKEAWFTTKFSYGHQNPFAGPSCPPNSPEPIWSQADQLLPESTCGKKTPGSETPLNGDAPCPPEGIRKPIGKQFVGVPKEEDLNLFQQMCTFDVIMHSEELAQIMYNLFAERLSARYFNLI